jgi:hypothetical protein
VSRLRLPYSAAADANIKRGWLSGITFLSAARRHHHGFGLVVNDAARIALTKRAAAAEQRQPLEEAGFTAAIAAVEDISAWMAGDTRLVEVANRQQI